VPSTHSAVATIMPMNEATSAIGVPVRPIAPDANQPTSAPAPPQATMAAR